MLVFVLLFFLLLGSEADATSFGVMSQSNPFGGAASAGLVNAQFARAQLPIAYKFCDTTASVCSYAYGTTSTPVGVSGGSTIVLASTAGMSNGDTMTASPLSGPATISLSGTTVTFTGATLTQNVYSWVSQLSNLQGYQTRGIPIYLTARNSCTAYSAGSCPETGGSAAYKADLTYTVQLICGPIVTCRFIAVESEPDLIGNTGSYTVPQYLTMLNDAVVAMHAIGYEVADGGLSGANASEYEWACLMYLDCYSVRASVAQQRLADLYARQTFFGAAHNSGVYNLLPTCAAPNDGFLAGNSFVAQNVAVVAQLEAGFAVSGEDYQNVHIYYQNPVPVQQLLAGYEQRRALPLIEGEIGNDSDDPVYVIAMLSDAQMAGLPYAMWWDFDTNNDVVALSDPSGNIRAGGAAFKNYVGSPYGTLQQSMAYSTC